MLQKPNLKKIEINVSFIIIIYRNWPQTQTTDNTTCFYSSRLGLGITQHPHYQVYAKNRVRIRKPKRIIIVLRKVFWQRSTLAFLALSSGAVITVLLNYLTTLSGSNYNRLSKSHLSELEQPKLYSCQTLSNLLQCFAHRCEVLSRTKRAYNNNKLCLYQQL